MKEFISSLCEVLMDSFKKHGFIPTALTIIGLLVFLAVVVAVWQLPDLIRAMNGR